MYLLLLLWLLTLFYFWKYWVCKNHHPNFFFARVLSRWRKRDMTRLIWEKIEKSNLFSQPGFLVKRLVKDKEIQRKIFIAEITLTLKGFKTMKQFVISGGACYLFFYFLLGFISWKSLFWSGLFFVFLFLLPDLYLQFQKEKKEKIFAHEVPYFIDLLSLILESGLNIEQALSFVCQGKKQALTRIVRQKMLGLNYGIGLEKILIDLKKIIPNEEFKNFIASIMQAKKLGVSLSHSLEIQSELIRTRRRQKAEELSRTAAVKISLPLVLFIFPALLLLYIGPGILHLMK